MRFIVYRVSDNPHRPGVAPNKPCEGAVLMEFPLSGTLTELGPITVWTLEVASLEELMALVTQCADPIMISPDRAVRRNDASTLCDHLGCVANLIIVDDYMY